MTCVTRAMATVAALAACIALACGSMGGPPGLGACGAKTLSPGQVALVSLEVIRSWDKFSRRGSSDACAVCRQVSAALRCRACSRNFQTLCTDKCGISLIPGKRSWRELCTSQRVRVQCLHTVFCALAFEAELDSRGPWHSRCMRRGRNQQIRLASRQIAGLLNCSVVQ